MYRRIVNEASRSTNESTSTTLHRSMPQAKRLMPEQGANAGFLATQIAVADAQDLRRRMQFCPPQKVDGVKHHFPGPHSINQTLQRSNSSRYCDSAQSAKPDLTRRIIKFLARSHVHMTHGYCIGRRRTCVLLPRRYSFGVSKTPKREGDRRSSHARTLNTLWPLFSKALFRQLDGYGHLTMIDDLIKERDRTLRRHFPADLWECAE